jgi:tetratricopeptide (TPR) repeat protein
MNEQSAIQRVYKLAVQHQEAGHIATAEQMLRQVIAGDPRHAEALHRLGVLNYDLGRLDLALQLLQQAAALNPNDVRFLGNLGRALGCLRRHEEEIAVYQRIIALRPDLPEAHYSLGLALEGSGRFYEAADAHRRAEGLPANLGQARVHRAQLLLLTGDFANGWRAHEDRWLVAHPKDVRKFPQPRWDGNRLPAARILLHAEQGLGDTIQFIRYAPLVKERVGHVIVQCPSVLRRLLQGTCGIDQLIDERDDLPAFDVWLPLLTLPLIFQTDAASMPAKLPYLFAKPQAADDWRRRLSQLSPGVNVGLRWAGRRDNNIDGQRSLSPQQLLALSGIKGVNFISLQKDDGSAALILPAEMDLIDWTSELHDLADTADLISALDLVISVDTSVAHLAGALGKQTWLMIPFAPDWRWQLGRDDSPWYPTMRMFRQPKVGDWNTLLLNVRRELEQIAICSR